MAIRAHYEGANGNRMRSILPGVIQNAKKDLSRATRRELLRNSVRSGRTTDGQGRGRAARHLHGGTGVRIEADSSDVAWNAKADAVFSQWAKYADLSSRQHAWKLQGDHLSRAADRRRSARNQDVRRQRQATNPS